MTPDHDHQGLFAATALAAVGSIMSLFIALGPCVRQEKVEGKVEHLERRIDNIQDWR